MDVSFFSRTVLVTAVVAALVGAGVGFGVAQFQVAASESKYEAQQGTTNDLIDYSGALASASDDASTACHELVLAYSDAALGLGDLVNRERAAQDAFFTRGNLWAGDVQHLYLLREDMEAIFGDMTDASRSHSDDCFNPAMPDAP